jgi:CRP-like cAMP-binding protein
MIASVDTQRSNAPSTEGLRKHNGCLSALSPAALSMLKPHLTEATLSEGAILWDAKRPAVDVYFPVSGLISIVLAMPDGECVEVGSVAREAAAGLAFDGDQSDVLTRGVVQIGGKFFRISRAQLLSAAYEIDHLITFCWDWILLQAQQIAACNAVHPADKRFCRWIFECGLRMEADTLQLTQEAIASVLGIRRTTVTLIAQTLQAHGSIHYKRGRISISDRTALRSAACECCDVLGEGHWPSTRVRAISAPTQPS